MGYTTDPLSFLVELGTQNQRTTKGEKTMETQTQTLTERRAQVQQITGQRVDGVQLDLKKMRELGVLVDIDVHGSSMFTSKTSWAELGIPTGDQRTKRLKRGQKDLIPHEYLGKLRSLETRFRQSLERHSFVLQGFRPWRWVPFTAYEKWRSEWDTLQNELTDLKGQIIENLETFRADIATDWKVIAFEAWAAIRARRNVDTEFALITGHGTYDTLEAFTAGLVDQATSQLPSAGAIEENLYVDYSNAMVVTGADVSEELARGQEAKNQAMLARNVEKLTRIETGHKLKMMEIETQEKQHIAQIKARDTAIRLEAMRSAELEHARKQIKSITSPWVEVIEQFRARISRDVADIADSIKRNGHVRGKVAEKARGLLDIYQLLGAAAGDDELEKALMDLRGSLVEVPKEARTQVGKYDTNSIETALSGLADLTHEAAQTVKRGLKNHTRAGALEL